jgi:hypothetical protein
MGKRVGRLGDESFRDMEGKWYAFLVQKISCEGPVN